MCAIGFPVVQAVLRLVCLDLESPVIALFISNWRFEPQLLFPMLF